jgi:RNA polymerase sigma factor (sigma-70 family)
LFESYQMLAHKMAGVAKVDPETRRDLDQEALIALYEASQKYDAGRRLPFPSFARIYIRGRINHYLRDHLDMIRTPCRVWEGDGPPVPCILEADYGFQTLQKQADFDGYDWHPGLDNLPDQGRGQVLRAITRALAAIRVTALDRRILTCLFLEERDVPETAKLLGLQLERVQSAADRHVGKLRWRVAQMLELYAAL